MLHAREQMLHAWKKSDELSMSTETSQASVAARYACKSDDKVRADMSVVSK